MNKELSNMVDEFLYLVEVGSSSALADESELAHLLDRIALAMRLVVPPEEPLEPQQIPARDIDVLKKVAASRFPTLGVYSRAQHPIESGNDATLEDAAADLAIIADHLHAVAWLWRNSTWNAGLWRLDESYRSHWGVAMRSLQLYLHFRSVERAKNDATG